jgi:hypothetical protein
MQRRAWFELHDHRLFPRFLRDLVTDALEAMWNAMNTYGPVVSRLRNLLRNAETDRIVDLCSGGGGPWLRLAQELKPEDAMWDRPPTEICLTDMYPNLRAFERLRREAAVTYCAQPVNAMDLPRNLAGVRTMFSSFHHFAPAEARAILRNAFDARQGIAVFETATMETRTLAAVFFVPLLAMLLTPRLRPFRWSRLFYTYLVPVIPFTLWFDGLLSCFRSYSLADLEELHAEMIADDYRWEAGIDRSCFIPIAYLLGWPTAGGASASSGKEVQRLAHQP